MQTLVISWEELGVKDSREWSKFMEKICWKPCDERAASFAETVSMRYSVNFRKNPTEAWPITKASPWDACL